MADARTTLLATVIDELAANGLTDRSLRELAAATGTSHRMLLYHFGSRAGLVAAVVAEIERRQRDVMMESAAVAESPGRLVRTLWERTSSPEMRPFVRLFFESLASTVHGGDESLSAAWLADGAAVAEQKGWSLDESELRLVVGLVRGLLIDVLATGDTTAASESLERFLAAWQGDS